MNCTDMCVFKSNYKREYVYLVERKLSVCVCCGVLGLAAQNYPGLDGVFVLGLQQIY